MLNDPERLFGVSWNGTRRNGKALNPQTLHALDSTQIKALTARQDAGTYLLSQGVVVGALVDQKRELTREGCGSEVLLRLV